MSAPNLATLATTPSSIRILRTLLDILVILVLRSLLLPLALGQSAYVGSLEARRLTQKVQYPAFSQLPSPGVPRLHHMPPSAVAKVMSKVVKRRELRSMITSW